MELLGDKDEPEEINSEPTDAAQLMAISQEAMSDLDSPRTVRLLGKIQ